MFRIGFIRNTHGIKGELKIKADNPVLNKKFKKPLYISTEPLTEVHIKDVKQSGDCLIIAFEEFDNINDVLKFKGLDLLINKEDLPPLEEDEYYFGDLIGLDVVNEQGDLKGQVTEVFTLPQCDYLRVKGLKKEHLVPFIDEFILDVTEDEIIVKEIEGLFDEN